MAEAAMAQLHLDELRVIPTGDAWHKPRQLSSGHHRAEMSRLAFGHLPQVVVDDIELRRVGPSYTIDTLQDLMALHPSAQFFIVIGADQAKALGTWREIDQIAQRAIICVAEREAAETSDATVPRHDIPTQVLKLAQLPHSATEVRARVANGQPIDALVSKPVALYIQRHHLYLPER